MFTRLSSKDQLTHEQNQSGQEVEHLSAEFEIYKIELTALEFQYGAFLKKLTTKVQD